MGGNAIGSDTDDSGSLDGSLRVNGVFGRRMFDVDEAGGDSVITLEDHRCGSAPKNHPIRLPAGTLPRGAFSMLYQHVTVSQAKRDHTSTPIGGI